MDDARLQVALHDAASTSSAPGHEHAKRIVNRRHFKVAWSLNAADLRLNQNACAIIAEALTTRYGAENVRKDTYSKAQRTDFPVLMRDGKINWAQSVSDVVRNLSLSPLATEFVLVEPTLRDEARDWLRPNLADILRAQPQEQE